VANPLQHACSDLVVTNISPESASFDFRNPEHWDSLGVPTQTDAGIRVTPATAFEVASFWQGVSMISGDIAGSPLDCYKRNRDTDERNVDWNHPAEFLVNGEANDDTPSFEFWRRMIAHAIVWESAYAWIDRRGPNGPPLGLYNLLPDRTKPVWDNGVLRYQTEVEGKLIVLEKWEVLQIQGLSIENKLGLEMLCKARNELGLSLAARGFASKFFENGAKAGGVLEIPANFSEKASKNLEEGFRQTESRNGWFKTVILREGAKFHQMTVSPADSKLNELREHEAREMARFLNMPPSKLGLSGSVSYNSAAVAQQDYLFQTLRPWLNAIVGQCSMKLLTRDQRKSMSHYFEHNTSKMLEIDPVAMTSMLQMQIQSTIINPNEARRKLNMNARPGGDEYGNPNTKTDPAAKPADDPAEPDPKKPAKARASLGVAFADAVNRVARRVSVHARKNAKNTLAFESWIDSRAQDHRQVFDEAVGPILSVVCELYELDPTDTLVAIEGRFFGEFLDRLRPLVAPPHKANDLPANVDTACAEFEAQIAAKLEPLVFGKDAA
jgi:HK97 family phage portal protein